MNFYHTDTWKSVYGAKTQPDGIISCFHLVSDTVLGQNTLDTAENHSPSHASGKSRSVGIIIIGVIVLTLLAVWLVPGDKPEHADIPLPAVTDKPAESPTASTPGTDAEPTPPDAPKQEGDEARDFINKTRQNGGSPDILYQQANESMQSGKLVDAHLLNFEAARQGHAAAAMVLAQQADPAFHSAANSALDKPDIIQARKWYLVAASNGDKTASELLDKLHQTVIARAAAGDPQAGHLLLQWK